MGTPRIEPGFQPATGPRLRYMFSDAGIQNVIAPRRVDIFPDGFGPEGRMKVVGGKPAAGAPTGSIPPDFQRPGRGA